MSNSAPRSIERIRHHFEVERELARRLQNSTREERTELFKTLYTELFARVPDHPRLTNRDDASASALYTQSQMKLVREHLKPETVFLEFAPGDCRLAHAVAGLVEKVLAVDISDQRAPGEVCPANVDFIVYDGYHLAVPEQSVDVIFSYQFIEHLHPDDVDSHFELARQLLRPGGVYVFDTPHRYSGPHDVSVHFSQKCECFHFQEWTYREMLRLLRRHEFGKCHPFRMGHEQANPGFTSLICSIEFLLGILPHRLRRTLSRRIFPSVAFVAHRI